MYTKEQNASYMEIYDYLKRNIINNKYPDEYVFVETDIAAELNVSRTPVREAIRMLKAEKYLVRVPKEGIKCRSIQNAEIKAVYETAEAIEGMMAYTVARNQNKANNQELRLCVEKMERALKNCNEQEWAEGDVEFHEKLAEFAANSFLKDMMENINNYICIIRNRVSMRNTDLRERSTIQHREAFEAINAGDADFARMLVQYHWHSVRRSLLQKK